MLHCARTASNFTEQSTTHTNGDVDSRAVSEMLGLVPFSAGATLDVTKSRRHYGITVLATG